METKQKTKTTVYLIELNTMGVKEKKIFGNKKGLHKYINEYLEQHYLEYDSKMMKVYKTFLKYTKGMERGEEWIKTIKATKVKMTYMELIKNY